MQCFGKLVCKDISEFDNAADRLVCDSYLKQGGQWQKRHHISDHCFDRVKE